MVGLKKPLISVHEITDKASISYKKTTDATSVNAPEIAPQSELVTICAACRDGKAETDLMIATCGDYYCKECITRLFDQATVEESLYPPRCCHKPIPLSVARPFIGEELAVKFERKATEFDTPERTYCYASECSAFIIPGHIDGDKAICAECDRVTCKVCKSAAHENDCPEDPALEGVMAVVAAEGYQQCPQCKRLVELVFGCNHITYVTLKYICG